MKSKATEKHSTFKIIYKKKKMKRKRKELLVRKGVVNLEKVGAKVD